MKNKILAIGFIFVALLSVTMISGCTSDSSTNNTDDIIVENQDVQSNGEGYPGEWMVTFFFRSASDATPQNVTFNITLLDKNNEILKSELYTVDRPFSGSGNTAPIVVIKDVKGEVKNVNVTAIN